MSTKNGFLERIPSEDEDREIGVPIYNILSYPSDPTLEVIFDRLDRGEIAISGFQRKWVWSHTQASRLIESFLLGLPVPPIFVFKDPTEKQFVIDGQQRLGTIFGFFKGELPNGSKFYLKGVNPKWEGKYYDTLEEPERIRFRDSVLRVVVVQQIDPQDNTSIYHIFERLNTGGTSLNDQEVRNCVYHGPFNDFLVELNKYKKWRLIIGKQNLDQRMRDIELLIRFFSLHENLALYSKPMKQFLNDFMAKHQKDKAVDSFRILFCKTVDRVYKALGERPFHVKRGLNVAAFDSIMIAFAKPGIIPKDITDRFLKLKQNPSYNDAISSNTTDNEIVKRRIQIAQEILFK